MAILCPKCSANVPARAVNLERMVAKCESCDEVFRFEAQLGARSAAGVARPPRPPSIEVDGELPPEPAADEGGYRVAARRTRGPLRLSYRWFRPLTIFTLLFSFFWCGMLAFMYAGMIGSGAPLEALLFPLLHVAVGVGLAYWSLAGLLNRTVIAIEGDTLRVQHAPLPWFVTPSVPIDRIRQLFVRRRVTRGKNGTSVSYSVCAEVDGTAIDLVRGLWEHDEACYLERVIEDHLSIADDPQAGDGA